MHSQYVRHRETFYLGSDELGRGKQMAGFLFCIEEERVKEKISPFFTMSIEK